MQKHNETLQEQSAKAVIALNNFLKVLFLPAVQKINRALKNIKNFSRTNKKGR